MGRGASENHSGRRAGMPRYLTSTLTVRDLFVELDGQFFASDSAFQEAVRGAYNARLWDFPPRYTYLDAILWAKRQGWLSPIDGGVRVGLHEADKGACSAELRRAA